VPNSLNNRLKILRLVGVNWLELVMKPALSLLIVGLGITSTFAQNVLVLGGLGTTPEPSNVYAPPAIENAPTYAYLPVHALFVAVPVIPVYATPAYAEPAYYSSYTYSSPNVIYVGGPGSCGPTYYDSPPCSTPNVIYFGRIQASREGYHFRHCR
jgi:hypothetical protein